MKTLLKAALLVLFTLQFGTAQADDVLIRFKDGATQVECSFANLALAVGFFGEFENPTIVGTCEPLPTTTTPPTPAVPLVFPLFPPIAPWCDCTDEEWRTIHELFAERQFIVNPGYGQLDQNTAWANALGTTQEKIGDPTFWSNLTVPDLEALENNQFLYSSE